MQKNNIYKRGKTIQKRIEFEVMCSDFDETLGNQVFSTLISVKCFFF